MEIGRAERIFDGNGLSAREVNDLFAGLQRVSRLECLRLHNPALASRPSDDVIAGLGNILRLPGAVRENRFHGGLPFGGPGVNLRHLAIDLATAVEGIG